VFRDADRSRRKGIFLRDSPLIHFLKSEHLGLQSTVVKLVHVLSRVFQMF